MKNFRKLFTTGMALLMTVAFIAVSANAQGRYSQQYSATYVKGLIDKLDRSSKTFKRDFDRAMDRSPLNGTSTEDRFNGYVGDFERSMNNLKNRFNRNNWWDNRSNVQDMLQKAQPVNQMMNGLPFARQLENQWNAMRNDINVVADTFDLPGINGGGWNGGNWGGGGGNWGNQGRPPTWAVGTWYWTGGNRQLVINANGQVTVRSGNDVQYGNWAQNALMLNGQRSTVTRNGNNIRTYNQANGETSDYSRTQSGGGWGGGGGWNNQVPSWAVGSFRWVQGPNRTMVINNNGQITLYINNDVQYGRWENGMISLGGNSSTVTQTRNGFRTYNQNTGETSDYRRQ